MEMTRMEDLTQTKLHTKRLRPALWKKQICIQRVKERHKDMRLKVFYQGPVGYCSKKDFIG